MRCTPSPASSPLGGAALAAAAALGVVLLLAGGARAIDQCSGFDSCADCLQHDFCGWCSPGPVVYNNGTYGHRCADQRDAPWTCDNLYQTTQCIAGWVCDPVAGQCKQTTPGEGDTKAHCESGCKKVAYFKCNFGNATCSSCSDPNEPGCQKFGAAADCEKACATPPELYECDAASRTCSSCGASSYCKTNADCPGSYCDIKGFGPWTCHGSTCQQEDKCKNDCGLNPLLVGVWRGIQIDASYQPGEISMNVTASGGITVKAQDGSVATGSVVKALANELLVNVGGKFHNVTWKSWEPSPETLQLAFTVAAPGNAPSAGTAKAMNGGDYMVLAMQKCQPHVGPQCDFDGAFAAAADAAVAYERALRGTAFSLPQTPVDHCNTNKDCSSCLNDPSGLCGWCDTPVVYKDGQPGAQCAGFDPDGKADPSWICNVRYRRESCFDYGCDWTDPGNPTCKQLPSGTPGISKQKCEAGCKQPDGLYKCNNQTFQCEKCDVQYCTTDKDCPGSYCQVDHSKPGPYICHGGMPDDCSNAGHCNATCSVPILGVWRGIEVSNNFVRGEWDFTATSDGVLAWRDPAGNKVVAHIHGGDQSAVSAGIAITLTSDSGEVIANAVATTRKGIFLLDTQGNENIVNMVTLAFSASEQPTDFGMAMKDSEFVLLECDDSSPVCDFSSSAVAPSFA